MEFCLRSGRDLEFSQASMSARKTAAKSSGKSAGKQSEQPAEPQLSFEEAIDQLEEITRKLEGGALSLDESIQAYETGMQLKKHCQTMLERAEKKLEYLERKSDGELERKAIETDEDDEGDGERSHADQSRLFQLHGDG